MIDLSVRNLLDTGNLQLPLAGIYGEVAGLPGKVQTILLHIAIHIFSGMLPRMGWIEVLKQSLDVFGAQVKPARSPGYSPLPSRKVDPKDLGFTNNAQSKMREWHLSEADVKDVFYHGGVVVKQNMMVKKYNGYEIGLYYFQDKQTGRFIISSVWKRSRY